MKNNLKTKVMLAVLAGNMFCMGSAFALGASVWYGDPDNANGWKATSNPTIAGRTSGANLTLDGTGSFEDVNPNTSGGPISFDEVEIFYGGYSESGSVIDNTVTINGGTFNTSDQCVYGGYSESGNASNNIVVIKNGNFTNDSYIYGGQSSFGNASNNTVVIKNGNFTNNSCICGGASYSGDAIGNSVIIDGGTFGDGQSFVYIFGGISLGSNGSAEGNTVTINGGTFNDTEIYGGQSIFGNASNNTVIIKNGNFTNDSCIGGGTSLGGDAIGNSVIIDGGTFGDVYIFGGSSLGSNGPAEGNTVTINGGTFNDASILVGCSIGNSSNNILNVNTKVKGSFSAVGYAQTINFTLPADVKNGDIMLNTGALAVDTKGGTATVNVYAANGVLLKTGDKITLIDVSEDKTSDDGDGAYDKYVAGDILGGAGKLVYEVNGAEQTTAENLDEVSLKIILEMLQDFGQKSGDDAATIKAVAEGIAASLAFVNQGADMVSGSGIDALYTADSENPAIAAFMGSKNRYNTGSHVDIHGWNALAGVALNNKAGFSHGVFVEIGNADIDTYAALDGTGSSDYKGGGYMLRKELGKGWNLDGAVRAGRVETSWSNNDKGGYEAKQTYYGAHVTFNKMLKEYGEQKLNGYLRYTFTHLGSDSVNLDGTHYGFDSVNSHRTRLGARMVDEGQNGFELYYGAAWEYGFGGDCDATVNGVTTSGPAVDGSNAVFEVGGTWSDKKWDISAGLEGYAGAKRGIAGGMNFVYKF